MTAYYQFAYVPFSPRAADKMPLPSPGELNTSLRHVPYSDANVLDIGGRGPRMYAAEIRVDPFYGADIENQLGLTDTLILMGSNFGQATLTKLTGKGIDPVQQKWLWYDAEWVIGAGYGEKP